MHCIITIERYRHTITHGMRWYTNACAISEKVALLYLWILAYPTWRLSTRFESLRSCSQVIRYNYTLIRNRLAIFPETELVLDASRLMAIGPITAATVFLPFRVKDTELQPKSQKNIPHSSIIWLESHQVPFKISFRHKLFD